MDPITPHLSGVFLIPLKIIEGELGSVMHAIKQTDEQFSGFGEAYFSTVLPGKIKGWKKHQQMTLNLVVPVGQIKFVIYDDRSEQTLANPFFEVVLSPENYCRLTVPPGVWMGFQGVGTNTNMLLNLASIVHDPAEAIAQNLNAIPYSW